MMVWWKLNSVLIWYGMTHEDSADEDDGAMIDNLSERQRNKCCSRCCVRHLETN
jgi:hypothetical protein